jgi:hypothetical protein
MSFRDLNKYPGMKAKYDKYKAWQDKDPGQRSAAYEAVAKAADRTKPEKRAGLVSPFNTVGNTLVYVNARILSATQSGAGAALAAIVRGLVDEFTFETVPANGIAVNTKRFKPAKLGLTTVVPATTKTASRITGALYYKPDVDTVSSPFGQKTGGQDYDAVVALIKAKAAYTTHMAGNAGKNRSTFTPEE